MELVKTEKISDCEDSDSSIELNEDDKGYIQALMDERYRVKASAHSKKAQCVLPYHICHKIKQSANPESTNTFLDLIFMENENDFEFTKEKRRKIIQSVVSEFIESERKKQETRKLKKMNAVASKIKSKSRKHLMSERAHRYSVTPFGKQLTEKYCHGSTNRSSVTKRHLKVKKEVRNKLNTKPLKPQTSQQNKYKIPPSKIRDDKQPHHKNHQNTIMVERNQNPSGTVYKNDIRLSSSVKKVQPHENQYSRPEVDTSNIEQNRTEKPDKSYKTARASEQNPGVEPSVVMKNVESEGTNKSFVAPPHAVQKPSIKKRLKFPEYKKELLPPIKAPWDPFYISPEHMDIIPMFQERLAVQGWNPTQVLYEMCSYCGWGKPEFLDGGSVYSGFLCCVRIKGFGFMAKLRGQTKKIARHLASTRFLNQIGFKFRFNGHSRVPLGHSRVPLGHSRVPLKSINPYNNQFVDPRGQCQQSV